MSTQAPATRGSAGLIVPLIAGLLVALTLGVYGRFHEPTYFSVNVAGFSSPTAVKAWLATIAIAFAVFQLVSAFVMYGKVPSVRTPAWIGTAHRWSGRVAVLASVPVAVHCLYALGFQDYSTRVLAHSLFGCFFYGVFVTKMLILTKKGLPAWALPVFGGLVFTGLTGLWLTSSLWFFSNNGLTF
ncbi:DUF6529 family protein [Hoyosella subflava]|uniref:Uncharacterized protein n=1 Tax=Hoyosella subflava (strain DSM 45089 / JCM 17490 / NBRC 109087 / DQS3-9A1) TaxID=443218 RepID=F6EGF6_HOYSD|nr:DUF6529 family protein [Hoyosella subflava]AEF41009.1 hypothetical protein AS9A_2562 [Hoyosella subflava DQS3-9A1]